MIHETGDRILDNLEKRIGGLALPQILRWIAGFQVLSWALSRFSPDFLSWIVFDRSAILSGEVWRLVTWVLFPTSDFVLFVLIVALFLFFINDSLERHWDTFRLNAYIVSTVVMLSIAGLLVQGAGPLLNNIFYSSAFLAFATLFPDYVVHLFAVIPIKAKWLGWANAALLAGMIFLGGNPLIVGIIVGLGLLPYFVVFVPTFMSDFKERGETAVRRHRFEQGGGGDEEAFHECEVCGATDKTHPERDFRVAADGREICSECRKTAAS
ncbi:MAG: hypothetical protein WD342_20840 [Verrucomicrobiales bacterium]